VLHAPPIGTGVLVGVTVLVGVAVGVAVGVVLGVSLGVAVGAVFVGDAVGVAEGVLVTVGTVHPPSEVTDATGGQKPSSWSCFSKPVSRKYLQKKSFGIVSYRQKISVVPQLWSITGRPARSSGGHVNDPTPACTEPGRTSHKMPNAPPMMTFALRCRDAICGFVSWHNERALGKPTCHVALERSGEPRRLRLLPERREIRCGAGGLASWLCAMESDGAMTVAQGCKAEMEAANAPDQASGLSGVRAPLIPPYYPS
jgi:hypothetical protein